MSDKEMEILTSYLNLSIKDFKNIDDTFYIKKDKLENLISKNDSKKIDKRTKDLDIEISLCQSGEAYNKAFIHKDKIEIITNLPEQIEPLLIEALHQHALDKEKNQTVLQKAFFDKRELVIVQNMKLLAEQKPKGVGSFKEFNALFDSKNRVQTPIREVHVDSKFAYSHLTRNSNHENRYKIASAFVETLKKPLFAVKKERDDEFNNVVFYKPYVGEKGIYNLSNFTKIKHDGLFHSTFFDIHLYQLTRLLQASNEDLYYVDDEAMEKLFNNPKFIRRDGLNATEIFGKLSQSMIGTTSNPDKSIANIISDVKENIYFIKKGDENHIEDRIKALFSIIPDETQMSSVSDLLSENELYATDLDKDFVKKLFEYNKNNDTFYFQTSNKNPEDFHLSFEKSNSIKSLSSLTLSDPTEDNSFTSKIS